MNNVLVFGEFGETVRGDIEHLYNTWSDAPAYTTLLRDSAVLRRLLVDGTLQQYRRSQGLRGEPELTAADMVAYAKATGSPKIAYLSAARAKIGHIISQGFFDYHGGTSRFPPDAKPFIRPISLTRYLSEPGVIVQNEGIARRDIVKFVANKLGGVHFDARRKAGETAYVLLDSVKYAEFAWVHVGDPNDPGVPPDPPRGPLFLDLIAIGQALIASPDVAKLIGVQPFDYT